MVQATVAWEQHGEPQHPLVGLFTWFMLCYSATTVYAACDKKQNDCRKSLYLIFAETTFIVQKRAGSVLAEHYLFANIEMPILTYLLFCGPHTYMRKIHDRAVLRSLNKNKWAGH